MNKKIFLLKLRSQETPLYIECHLETGAHARKHLARLPRELREMI